jgi:ABC-type lipoprotein export system ATPase subunit
MNISILKLSLVVLMGPSGAGKTTSVYERSFSTTVSRMANCHRRSYNGFQYSARRGSKWHQQRRLAPD